MMELLVKVTVLLMAVGLARLVASRVSAAAGHLTLVAGLACTLLLPLAMVAAPSWDLVVPRTSFALGTTSDGGSIAPLPGVMTSLGSPGGVWSGGGSSTADYRLEDVPQRKASAASQPPAIPWGTLTWAAGFLFVFSRALFGWVRMARIASNATAIVDDRIAKLAEHCRARLGLRRSPRLACTEDVDVPLVWGILRSRVFLPAEAVSWPTERLRIALLHEMAHLRRRDILAVWIGRMAAALYWFHPMTWLLERTARREAERACDDIVVSCGERASDYAGHLVAIARDLAAPRPAHAGTLALVRRSQLEHRVREILRPGPRRNTGGRMIAATMTAALALVAVIGGARVVAADDTNDAARLADRQLAARELALELLEPVPPTPPVAPVAETPPAPPAPPALPEKGYFVAQSRAEREEIHRQLKEKAHHLKHKAHKMAEKAHRMYEGDEEGAAAFAEAYEMHSAERFDEAIRGFGEAYDAGFRKATAAYNAACGHGRLGQADEALAWLDKAMDSGWDDFDYFYEDSDLDPIRSDPAFRELLERVGGSAGDRYTGAVEMFEELDDRGTTDADAWHEVGTALLMTRQLDRAVEALEHAVEYSDGDDTSLYNLACALSLNGKTGEALDRLEQAVRNGFSSEERFENDTDLDNLRGEARFAEIAEMNRFLSLDRFRHNDHGSWFGGDSEYSKTRWKTAVTEFGAYVDRNPSVGRAWFNLGWATHFSRRHDQAVEAFSRAAELGFREATSTYNAACANAMAGNTNAALDALEEAVELGFISPSHMAEDDDLKSLRDDPRFDRILDEAAAKSGHEHGNWKWWKRMMKHVGLD